MRIDQMFKTRDVVISLEVFPPKMDSSFETVLRAVEQLSSSKPDFMSVTYGAGGGTSKNTIEIASFIKHKLNTTALAHLSCVSSSRDEVSALIDDLQAKGIENVLALRGDIPQDMVFPDAGYYKYALDLVEEIKTRGNFCIGAACYPEGHVESANKEEDMKYLKAKVDSGIDFLITQMFFDNNVLYSFLYNALRNGIDVPIAAGVMPVTNSRQIDRICDMAGTALTPKFKTIVDKFGDNPDALKQAGIAYATDQIVDLIANGVKGIHIYTMNKPDIALKIIDNLSHILNAN
ncbi:MAG TPA: methylenetetrahydrofolate reductase [NAD(P)H] [Clostridia bacterium]|nr:methylenetetrahydrofolate reductase [NAD(P)H] [Clostridia bacterium]